jgi:hypothetical protein
MPRDIELTVAPPYVGDISCVRLDSASMSILGVREGEEVIITSLPRLGIPSGIRNSAKVAKAKVTDEGKGLIRISPDFRGFSIGQKVIVMK